MMEKELKIVQGFIFAAILAVIFITVITVVTDLYPPLKDWLKVIFTHHWIGKSVVSFVIFLVVGAIASFFARVASIEKITKQLYFLFWSSVAGSAIISFFFLWEAFLKGK
jgi:hypothetical protein